MSAKCATQAPSSRPSHVVKRVPTCPVSRVIKVSASPPEDALLHPGVVITSSRLPNFHGFMTVLFDASLHRTKAIRLFRYLLRESGYLPDVVARREVRNQIILRFRNKLPNRLELLQKASLQNHTGSTSIDQRDEAVATLQQRMRTGESVLKTLRNANQGAPRSLHKVLLYAYGRTGKRRHELLRPLLRISQEICSNALETPSASDKGSKIDADFKIHIPVKAVFDPPKKSKDENYVEFHISPQYALLKSLARSQLHSYKPGIRFNRGRLKAIVFKMPRFNIWKRQMPQKRVKNMLNKWYAKLIDSLLPPLPEGEWHHLMQLATGAKPFNLIKRRQARGKPDHLSTLDLKNVLVLDPGNIRSPSCESNPQSYQETASSGNNLSSWNKDDTQLKGTWLEDKMRVREVIDDILGSELQAGANIPVKHNRKDVSHQLTPRALKRMYGKIFRHCSLMENDGTGRWKITWGSEVLDAKPTYRQLNTLFDLVAHGPQDIALEETKMR